MIKHGDKFGRLTVLKVYYPRRKDQFRVLCRCSCGEEVDTTGSRLRNGYKKSCGCLRKDRLGNLYRKHGKSKTPEYCMFYDARKRALKNDIPFNISPEDIVIPETCPVLGIELHFGKERDSTPSLDRIVPSLGYVTGNIQVISFRANRIKSDATVEELQKIIKYMEDQT